MLWCNCSRSLAVFGIESKQNYSLRNFLVLNCSSWIYLSLSLKDSEKKEKLNRKKCQLSKLCSSSTLMMMLNNKNIYDVDWMTLMIRKINKELNLTSWINPKSFFFRKLIEVEMNCMWCRRNHFLHINAIVTSSWSLKTSTDEIRLFIYFSSSSAWFDFFHLNDDVTFSWHIKK